MTSRMFAALGLALAVGVVLVQPADAGITPSCGASATHGDGRVRLVGDPYQGEGIYECAGNGQKAQQLRAPGQKMKFDLRIENDSDKTRDVYLIVVDDNDIGPVNPDFRLTLTARGRDVTDAAYYTGSGDKYGKRFKTVPAGASTPAVHGVIKVKNSADPQSLDLALYSFVHYKFETVRNSTQYADQPHAIVGVLPPT